MHPTYSLFEYMPSVFRALGLTIWLSWLALILGALGGLVLGLMRTSRFRTLRLVALLYVEFFRSIPILIILFFFFYGAPLVFKINVSAFLAATAALSAHASALMSEVIRAGIESVGRGQWEAAQSSGMTYPQVMRHVVGPQAMQHLHHDPQGILDRLDHRLCRADGDRASDPRGAWRGLRHPRHHHRPLFHRLLRDLAGGRCAGASHENRRKRPANGRSTMSQSPVLKIDTLTKKFGSRTIIDGISMTVVPGEIVCLVGPSGTGKSTLLRCVNGLEDIQGGEIRFEDKPVRAHAKDIIDVRKRIGMIFQQFNLYPHLTARQNIVLAQVVVHGIDARAAAEKADQLLTRVRLAHRADAYPARLSGGEQQRVAIARALATNPHMLMFDEPTSALDPETVGEVLAVMREIAEEGRTMLVVTHEMRFAADVGTRMVFMDEGKIVEEGPPRELLAHPKTERAQRFLQTIHH
jgi:His/Glu/Gln/Arg/opine family amino acid ABC transporter permease subunit